MENKDNNLGDFFRKKFSEFDGSEGEWGRPDVSVRENLLDEISTAQKPAAASVSNLFWKIALIVALLLLGGFAFYLRTENRNLQQALNEQKSKTEIINEELINQKEAFENKITQLEKNINNQISESESIEKNNQERLAEIDLLRVKNTRLNSENTELKNEKIQLLLEVEEIKNRPKEIVEIVKSENGENIFLETIKAVLPIALAQKVELKENEGGITEDETLEEKVEKPELNLEKEIKTIETKRKKFEVGYEYALMGLDLSTERRFALQRDVAQNSQSRKINAHSNGAFFAYSPRENFWLRGGVRFSSVSFSNSYVTGLDYDKEMETVEPNGSTSNQLMLTTSTPYSETQAEFNVRFPDGEELNNGDLLRVAITDLQRLNYLQIPFGVEYHFGEKRLKWLIQGGGVINRISIGDYSFTVRTFARNRIVPVERERVVSRDIPRQFYLGMYGGAGADFQLVNNFHLRASVNWNRDFLRSNQADRFSNSPRTGTTLRLGMNYRF